MLSSINFEFIVRKVREMQNLIFTLKKNKLTYKNYHID